MKLQEVFNELVLEANENPNGYCIDRAKRLAGAFKNHGECPLILEIRHRFSYLDSEAMYSGLSLKPRGIKTKWNHHWAVLVGKHVWDPSFKEPVPKEDYIRSCYKNFPYFVRVEQGSQFLGCCLVGNTIVWKR